MNSVCFFPISVQLLTVLVDCCSKIEEFPNRMAISSSDFQRQIILSQKTDRIRDSVLSIWAHSFLFCLLTCLSCSVPEFHLVPHGFTAPFGRPSAFLEFLHSLSLFTRSVQETTPEGVLSSCWCSLILTLTTSIGIWHGAGVTKGVTSPAAHRGIWHGVGATKGVTSPAAHRGIWHGVGATKACLHSTSLKTSFALIKKVSRQPKLLSR